MEKILNNVTELAIEVGRFQRTQLKTFDRHCVELKSSHDYVSYVDKESERMIVERLSQIMPQAEFITEEKTTKQTGQGAEYVWIVDPLDGTTNYIHGLGPWCVSIALRDSRGLLLGVVYEPRSDELFYALRGQGAWSRQADGSLSLIRVSTVAEVDQALVIVGFPYDADAFRDLCVRMCADLYGHCASIRSLGSAEVELCYVAAGRIDIYFESCLQPWDVSAGALIVQEAGGRVSDYSGGDALWPSGREMLATNGVLHEPMLRLLSKNM